jgi:hypothetical protein
MVRSDTLGDLSVLPNEIITMVIEKLPFGALRIVAETSKGMYSLVKRVTKNLPDAVDSYGYIKTTYSLMGLYHPDHVGKWVKEFSWDTHKRESLEMGVDPLRFEGYQSAGLGTNALGDVDRREWSHLVVCVVQSDTHAGRLGQFLEARRSQAQAQVDLADIIGDTGDVATVRRLRTDAAALGYPQVARSAWVQLCVDKDYPDMLLYLWDEGVRLSALYAKCTKQASLGCVRAIDGRPGMRSLIDLHNTGDSPKAAAMRAYFEAKHAAGQ